MNHENFSTPLDLRKIQVTDEFWHREQELVRTEVIPYQWEALRLEDSIELVFDLSVKVQMANPNVRENIGKVAVTRGPITFCLEEIDNGDRLYQCRLDVEALKDSPAKVEFSEELGHRMAVITMPGKRMVTEENAQLYAEYAPMAEKAMNLRFVPYYAWNNRGQGEMTVWIRC